MVKISKAVVVGCGRIGALTRKRTGDREPISHFPTNHCDAIRATSGIKLIAICDTNFESAKKAGKLHKVKNIYTDFRKMIIEQSPDIVSIATRMDGRTEIISFAANNGVGGIHIEKPLSNNLIDANKTIQSIIKNNVAISYGTIRRYMAIYKQAKQILKSKNLGKLQQVIVNFGKSQLMWTHPHSVDLIVFFADSTDVDYVQSSFEYKNNDIKTNKIDMDPVLNFGFIKFKNGVSGLITGASGKYVKLVCEHGEILIVDDKNYLIIIDYKLKVQKKYKIASSASGRCIAISELRDFINYKKAPTITIEEIIVEQKILLALGYSGIKLGKKTSLSEIQNNFTITGRFNNLYP